MSQFILRFEPASLAPMVFDVEQLSAIRGASLACLYSPELVQRTLDAVLPGKTEKIFAGGSNGAWLVNTGREDALSALKAVRAALDCDDLAGPAPTGPHSQLIFHVCLVPVEGDAMQAFNNAIAVNRAAQSQDAGIVLPQFDASARGVAKGDHDADRIRPATVPLEEGSKELVSPNYRLRHAFGRAQRSKFYGRFLEERLDFEVIDNLQQLVSKPPKGTPKSLRNKMALFHTDANRLGTHLKQAASLEEITRFSESLIARQKELLRTIVHWFKQGASGANGDRFMVGDEHRIEVLLFGGDELSFVVPSWLALDFAELFFRTVGDWKSAAGPITFSAGLVICDRKTPIRQAKTIADAMVNSMKTMQEQESKFATRNLLQIEVFESLSLPEVSFEDYRKRLYLAEAGVQDENAADRLKTHLTLAGEDTASLISAISALKGVLPRSQLYRMLQFASAGGAAMARSGADRNLETMFDDWLKRVDKKRSGLVAGDIDILRKLRATQEFHRKCGAGTAPRTVSIGMLASLWDYCMPFAGAEEEEVAA